jgi:hypothetical protein
MIGLSDIPANRRSVENTAEVQRNIRRAPYSPVARAQMSRKRNSITSLNLNATGSQSENSSDSVSPEPLSSSSMPPPPPRNLLSNKLYEKSSNERHQKNQRQKRNTGPNPDVSPATPSSLLNMSLEDQHQGPHTRIDSIVTFDQGASTDTSPATVKSASSTPTFDPSSGAPSMGSPSFISIPTSYDPNISTIPNLNIPATVRHPARQSRRQSRSSSSSPAFKPIISPNLKPLLPGGIFLF